MKYDGESVYRLLLSFQPVVDGVVPAVWGDLLPEARAAYELFAIEMNGVLAGAWDKGKEYGLKRANREIPSQLNPYHKETE